MKINIHQQTILDVDIPLFIKNRRLSTLSEWETSFINFLEEWFDDKDYILAQTSGSTGIPKSIQLRKESMLASAKMTNHFFQLNKKSKLLLCLSANYIAGKMMIVRAIAANANLWVIEPSSTPVIDVNYDFAAMVPMQVETLLNKNRLDQLDKINCLIIGGSAISFTLEKRLQSINSSCYSTYGMTETVSHVALRAINGSLKTNRYIALEGIQFTTDDRDCLIIHAPHLNDTPLVTNDIVLLSDQHSFEWLGRWDNVINSGGVKLFPETIEQKINDLFSERYFIGSVPNERFGEMAVLVIEGKPFETEKRITIEKLLKERLSRYELPKEIIFTAQFEETSSGKIKRIVPIK